MASWRGYKAFFDRALQAHLAYGPTLMLALAGQATAFLITLLIWRHATSGMAASGLFHYLTLAFVLHFSFNIFLEQAVGQRIRDGLVATDLLKPVDFQLFYMLNSFSDTLFQIFVAMAVFVLGLAFLGSGLLPASPLSFLLFLPSFVLAFAVNYGIGFLFVQGAFVTNTSFGLSATRIALHQSFSGNFAPLAYYPPVLGAVAHVLPFRHVIHTPASIYLGWIPPAQAPWAWLEQGLWAAGLLLAGRLLFKAVLRQLAIQGG